MKQNNLTMTTGHPGSLLLRFALPLMFGNVFQQLYTVVDTAIVGQGVGMTALAALGTVDWLNWMYLGIIQGFCQGFSVRMAQKYGEADRQGLKHAFGNAARLALVIGAVTTVFSQMALGTFLTLLQVPQELRSLAELYSRVILLGIPAMMFYNLTAAMLRAVGDSRTPLKAMIAAALTNIVLDCVAVFWLEWGIAGAAAATVLAQILAGVLCTLRIMKSPELQFDRADMDADRALSAQMMGLGLPVAMQNVIIAVGGMAMQSVVNRFDTSFIAGFTATNKLYGILEIAAVSYGYAVTTYTGQNYGALLFDRIRKGIRWAILLSLATAAVIGGGMILLGRPITMLFISTETRELAVAAGETAYEYLCVMSVFLPVLYLLHAYRAALQGMGDTRVPLLSGVAEFVIRVGAAVVIGYTGYRTGLYYAEVLAWAGAAALLAAAYYRRAVRLKRTES